MRVIDLFAGCGGMSLGLQQAGYELCAAFDNWAPASAVYRHNFPHHPILAYDLGSFDGNAARFTRFAPDMIVGGPPCQDFSSAGKRDESGGRADLTKSFAAIVAAVRPAWFVMENVERAANSRAFAEARVILRTAGYGLTQIVLDASYCGVPQTRKRLFLIGQWGGSDQALVPYLLHNQATTPLTVRDYLGDRLGLDHYYRHPRSYARRGVFSVDEPSPTIRGVNRPVPPGYRPHPGDTAPPTTDLRPLTTHERSLIQTFPEDFIWVGTTVAVEQMIGNAVPVALAAYVGQCIRDYIEQCPLVPPVVLQSSFLWAAETV